MTSLYNVQMRKLVSFFGILAIFLSFFAGATFAKQPDNIPEVDGVYDAPGHPGMKVRVFVHKQKPTHNSGKPTPPPPTLQCELSDPGSSSVVGSTGWSLPSSWTYDLNTSSVPSSVGGGNLGTITSNAFSQWAGPTGVLFTRGSDTHTNKAAYDGQNIIAWGRTSGSALAVTYTWYYSSTGEVVDVDTIMNQKFAWSWANQTSDPLCAYSDTYDAQDILTHELGHWVGLDDEYDSSFSNNTMYGYGSKQEIKKDTLTSGDISGVQAIY